MKQGKGRPKNIPTPKYMWELFQAYIRWTKSNPYKVIDWVGKDAILVEREKERPLTFEGFESYLIREKIITDLSDYFENKEGRYSDFVPVCRAIKLAIRTDQIEGGMANMYNPSITQRLNGLAEKTENTNNVITVKIKED